jgi:predicted ester cyclase
MSEVDNLAVALRFNHEVQCQGKLNVLEEVMDPNVVHHSAFPGQPAGIEGVRQSVISLLEAFPDLNLAEDDSVAQGDKVWIRFNITGTHQGRFLDIEPTGRHFAIQEYFAARLQEGRIAEIWSMQDRLSFFQQLGVIAS